MKAQNTVCKLIALRAQNWAFDNLERRTSPAIIPIRPIAHKAKKYLWRLQSLDLGQSQNRSGFGLVLVWKRGNNCRDPWRGG
jgi:hypothetical protein